MKNGQKIAATLALVGVAVVGITEGRRGSGGDAPGERPAAPPVAALPSLALDPPAVEAITRVEITQPDWAVEDGGEHQTVVLEKQAGGWELTAPIRTRASVPKVGALLDNLAHLALRASLGADPGVADGARLGSDQAVHVTAWRGADRVRELYFGASDTRGQLVRLPGNDAVFALGTSGAGAYSGFLYTRDVRSWRDPGMVAFDEANVVAVEIANPSGRFVFTRTGYGWAGAFGRRPADGEGADMQASWPAFDPAKVDELLRAYHALAADDYGEPPQRAVSGVDDAEDAGGVVRFRMGKGERDQTVRVGRLSTNTGRWAIAGSRWAIVDGGDGTLYAMAPWTADWATSGPSRFERR